MLRIAITIITSILLAAVSGWFSIMGIAVIYAGAVIQAVIMGICAEIAKLVTASWLYQNWPESKWWIKMPLMFFLVVLMTITSIGVFGFLSKAHLDQASSTIDNSAKIATLDYQIEREKGIIADTEKIIGQLDSAVNSLIGKDRADRAITIRRSQAAQRKQLRDDIATSQAKIDELSKEKFSLESDVRKLELEVGPVRYIAGILYPDGDKKENMEKAVIIFTLLIVISLDPLAVMLLIAGNDSLMRFRRKDVPVIKDNLPVEDSVPPVEVKAEPTVEEPVIADPPKSQPSNLDAFMPDISVPKKSVALTKNPIRTKIEDKVNELEQKSDIVEPIDYPTVNTVDSLQNDPWAHQSTVLRELLGNGKHFVPTKVNDETSPNTVQADEERKEKDRLHRQDISTGAVLQKAKSVTPLSWINEFKGK